MINEKIKVLIIDDSALMRKIYTDFLTSTRTKVVGTAIDAIYAMKKIKDLQPDVLVLDIYMPQMDGLTFLEQLMKKSPLPVIVISAIVKKDEEMAVKALSLGALFFLEKPTSRDKIEVEKYKEDLIKKVIVCSETNFLRSSKQHVTKSTLKVHQIKKRDKFEIVAIGASTGGPQAIETLLRSVEYIDYILIIAIHMPARYTKEFSKRMNEISSLEIVEATDQMDLTPGKGYICPGGKHMQVLKSSNGYESYLLEPLPTDLYKPSIDILLNSIAKFKSPKTMGVIMTGMSNDGSQGLLSMRKNKSLTVIQDEKSSIIYGMPKSAKDNEAAEIELNLTNIIELLRVKEENK